MDDASVPYGQRLTHLVSVRNVRLTMKLVVGLLPPRLKKQGLGFLGLGFRV